MNTGRLHNPVATNSYLRTRKLKQFEEYLDSPILDIGAGFGQYTVALRKKGFVVDCIEPDNKMRNPGLDYICDHDYYKTGLLLNVLHHIDVDPKPFIEKYLDLCDRLIIGELNGNSWLVRNYHKVFKRDEIGRHISLNDFSALMNDFELIQFWCQDFGPFLNLHMFAVISRRVKKE